jgi:hypothetical protein
VGHRRLGPHEEAGWVGVASDNAQAFTWSDTAGRSAQLQGLAPGSAFAVVVARSGGGGATSDPVVFRTAATGVKYTTMTRVSEFTNNVDFLDNHDSATSPALAALMARMSKEVNVSAACLSSLGASCPRAQGTSCLACVRNLSSTSDACGGADMADYNEHFFCGEGWVRLARSRSLAAGYTAAVPCGRVPVCLCV